MNRCLGLAWPTVAAVLLTACAASDERAVDSAGVVTLTGEVTYVERIATPPGSRLRIQLLGLGALADDVVVAEQTYEDIGQPPFAFSLEYVSRRVRPGSDYGLQATLHDAAGHLLFSTQAPQALDLVRPGPVEVVMHAIPRGAPEIPSDGTRRTLVYSCSGRDVAVTFTGGDSLMIHLPDRALRLDRTESASGAHYSSDDHEFRSQDNAASLILDGGEAVTCRRRQRGDLN